MAIDPKLLRLNSSYSRAELGDIFGDEKIASSREGNYPAGDRVIFLSLWTRRTGTKPFRTRIILPMAYSIGKAEAPRRPTIKISAKFCLARRSGPSFLGR